MPRQTRRLRKETPLRAPRQTSHPKRIKNAKKTTADVHNAVHAKAVGPAYSKTFQFTTSPFYQIPRAP